MIICLDTSTCGSSIQPVCMVTNDPDTPSLCFIVTGTVIPAGDVDGDGVVGTNDLLELLAAWGLCPAPPEACPADLDGDNIVGTSDLLALLAAWGPCE